MIRRFIDRFRDRRAERARADAAIDRFLREEFARRQDTQAFDVLAELDRPNQN